MTKAGVLVANTPDAVRRPVATIALLLILALSHRLFTKDRLTRAGRWAERTEHMGMGLTGRTLCVSRTTCRTFIACPSLVCDVSGTFFRGLHTARQGMRTCSLTERCVVANVLPVCQPRAYALFAHCFTCSKDSKAAAYVSQALAGYGIATLRFDFSGLEFTDLLAAAGRLRENRAAPQVHAGHSLGGARRAAGRRARGP